jgi:hypothetical protein
MKATENLGRFAIGCTQNFHEGIVPPNAAGCVCYDRGDEASIVAAAGSHALVGVPWHEWLSHEVDVALVAQTAIRLRAQGPLSMTMCSRYKAPCVYFWF